MVYLINESMLCDTYESISVYLKMTLYMLYAPSLCFRKQHLLLLKSIYYSYSDRPSLIASLCSQLQFPSLADITLALCKYLSTFPLFP